MALLEVERVTHRYSGGEEGRPVLSEVSLNLHADELVALVGESGCGKTTLGRIVAGLIQPTTGTVRFDGDDISALGREQAKDWRLAVQLIHQDPYSSLNPGLTIGSMLGAGLLRNKLVNRRELQGRLLALLREVGLDDTPAFLHRYPHQLSGGQRQRVAIARTLSLQPRLVVADEVTSMLDVSMRVAILDLLLSFHGQRQMAYLFISHDFGVVRYFAQGGRVVVMFYGEVVEDGPTEELIRGPRHPYTYLLLQSLPVPDPTRARRRSLADPADSVEGPAPSGCVFSNRCPFAEAKCREHQPPLVEAGPGHHVACFFTERVPRPTQVQGGTTDGSTGSRGPDQGRAGHAGDVVAGPPDQHVQA